jgi:hypothetical protein
MIPRDSRLTRHSSCLTDGVHLTQTAPPNQPGMAGPAHVALRTFEQKNPVCRKIVEQWGHHQGLVMLYGDATGGAQGSARVQGSDWQLVQAELKPVYGRNLHFRVPNTTLVKG